MDDRSKVYKKAQSIARAVTLSIIGIVAILSPLYTTVPWRVIGISIGGTIAFVLLFGLICFLVDDGLPD